MVGCHNQPSFTRVVAKRKRFAPLTAALDETISRSPQYLVATRVDGESFMPVNPFLISKSIEGVAGDVDEMKKLRDGSVLIKTLNEDQSQKLMNCKNFGEYEVAITGHKSLNSCRRYNF